MFKIVASLFFILIPFGIMSQNIDILILNNQYEEALDQLNIQIEKEPTAKLYSKQGLIYNRQQNYQKGILAYENALKISPGSASILEELADANSILGNNKEAVTYFQKAVVIDSTNLPLIGKLGKSYVSLKDYKRGFDVFANIYSVDSTNVYWNKQLAFCASKVGKSKLAIDLYEKVLVLNPKDLSSRLNLITLYQMKKKYDLALSKIWEGQRYFSGNSELFLKWGNILFAKKQYAKAQFPYGRLLAQDTSYTVLKNYGICLYFTKFEEDALEVLELCADMNLNDPIVLFYISLCHKKLAQHEVAEGYMKGAIESATPYYLPEMYHHLGQIYGQQRKFPESIKALQKAYELDPTGFEVLFEIATTYEEYNFNKTLALNYYQDYLKEAGGEGRNTNYALDRIKRIKEEMFFEE